MSPVAVYYFIAMDLTNLHTIFYGSEVKKDFLLLYSGILFRWLSVEIESLEEYMSGFRQ